MSHIEELKSEIEDVFRMFDEDDSGSIDLSELSSAMHTVTGEPMSREDVLSIMQRYDVDGNGTIDRHEFQEMVLERIKSHSTQEECARAFRLLEERAALGSNGQRPSLTPTDSAPSSSEVSNLAYSSSAEPPNTNNYGGAVGTGYITIDSVRRAAADVGEKLTEAELAEMFDVMVTGQKTPAIDFPTFCSIQFAAENLNHQLTSGTGASGTSA